MRALYVDCEFPKFLTALLLLNASIFFVLFMNFYVQNYKKQQAAAAASLQKQKMLSEKMVFASTIKRETAYLTPKKID